MLRGELELALLCLKDHAAGRCPQIPYYSISLLAAGVTYLADQLDFVPDFLPRIGMIDDALVMAVAFDLGRDGLERYCVWKGIAPALARRRAAPGATRARCVTAPTLVSRSEIRHTILRVFSPLPALLLLEIVLTIWSSSRLDGAEIPRSLVRDFRNGTLNAAHGIVRLDVRPPSTEKV